MTVNNNWQNVDACEGIPFMPEMKMAIMNGNKCRTSRYKHYFNKMHFPVRDVLMIDNGCIYLLYTSCERKRLGDIKENYYLEEGVKSPMEFQELWERIHPRKGFRPLDRVWSYKFQVLEIERYKNE